MSALQHPTQWIKIAALFLGSVCHMAWAKTWTVGQPGTPCPNPDFALIAQAIAAARPGDQIDVCPALYREQLVISKPLELRGISQQGVSRAVIQPAQFTTVGSLSLTAVIAVVNTFNVTISNLAIDASNNTVSGCAIQLAGIQFYNSSGAVDGVAVSGTQLKDPTTCPGLFPGNGFGINAGQDAGVKGPFQVTVRNTTIHDFMRNGILATGPAMVVNIEGNSIAGVGPSTGYNQFGVFLANGVTGQVVGNNITQGNCGAIDIPDCFNLRSEGVVLRSTGPGVLVAGNTISNVQAGVFLNGTVGTSATVTNPKVVNNTISNVDALSGIHIQGVFSGLFSGNRIFHVGPFTGDTAYDEEGCGVNDVSGTNSLSNTIVENWINDAYCGVGYVTGDRVDENVYLNTLYDTLNGDLYPVTFPPPLEPGQAPSATPSQSVPVHREKKAH